MDDILKRKGTFKISTDLIETQTQEVLNVLRDILIVHTETDYFKGIIKYSGYSKHFDTIQECEVIPMYNIEIKSEGDEVKWIRYSEC